MRPYLSSIFANFRRGRWISSIRKYINDLTIFQRRTLYIF